MSSLWNTLTGWIARDSQKNLYLPIEHSHVKNPHYSPNPMQAGQHYFRLILAEMSLRRDREWFASWYPAVHSLVTFRFGDQKIEIPYIAGSLALKDLSVTNLERVIQLNHPLTSLVPFNGGDIDIIAGLLAMQGANYLNRFINVLTNFSKLLIVPQLSSTLSVAAPLVQGVEELLGVNNGALHLGFHQLFSKGGGNLQPGYTAVILAEENKINRNRLWVVDGQLRQGNSLDDNQPFSGYTYMLLKIESQEGRDDWESLSSIQQPFNNAIDALIKGKSQEAQSYLRQAIATALQSPDLTLGHRYVAARRLKERFDEIHDLGLGAAQPELSNLQLVMQGALPVSTALKLGKPDLETMFG